MRSNDTQGQYYNRGSSLYYVVYMPADNAMVCPHYMSVVLCERKTRLPGHLETQTFFLACRELWPNVHLHIFNRPTSKIKSGEAKNRQTRSFLRLVHRARAKVKEFIRRNVITTLNFARAPIFRGTRAHL